MTTEKPFVKIDIERAERTITVYALDDDGNDLFTPEVFAWGDDEVFRNLATARVHAELSAEKHAERLGGTYGANE